MDNKLKFICDISEKINWYSIISEISQKPGKIISPKESIWKNENPEYGKIYNKWIDADFNLESIQWINYYTGVDYSNSIVKVFEDQLNCVHIRSWISKINPGYCAAWHWDIDDHEEQYKKLGNIKRFICHIGDPDPGHVFVFEDCCHHNKKNGWIYEWEDYRAWHGGMNCGLKPKYLFNFLCHDLHKTSS